MLSSKIDLKEINSLAKDCMIGHIGIEITEVGENYLCGKMPVDERTKQPYGILHGGASVVLAETLGSFGSAYTIDLSKEAAVGLEINANHIRSVKSGFVHAKASLVHCGKKTHIWEIKIKNDEEKLVCLSRLTVAIIERKG